jgi:hypothetical protein
MMQPVWFAGPTIQRNPHLMIPNNFVCIWQNLERRMSEKILYEVYKSDTP